ncbi:MAG TPA: hypothetical protein VFA92_18025 [Candidatus Binatia bacterium]|jgi:nucleotide-binding universal stress UspA family protein|nr:hypothetical protein [Candidatus Binatia bacterium]
MRVADVRPVAVGVDGSALLGSVSEHGVTNAQCPVVGVRGDE